MGKRMSRRDMRQYICNNIKENEEGCWVWQLSLDKRGYGQAWDNSKVIKAHRLSYEAFNGPLEEWVDFTSSKVVMHLCHNPACVNPHHLKAGTQKENILTSSKEGRYSKYKGELNLRSSLANSQVIFARNLYKSGAFSYKDLACILGVKTHVVNDFMSRSYQIGG